MTKRIHRPKFAVLGTGNSGQAYAADISLKGYSVNLAEVSDFESLTFELSRKKAALNYPVMPGTVLQR